MGKSARSTGCLNLYLRTVSYAFLLMTLAADMIALCTSNWYSSVNKGDLNFMGIWNICRGKADRIGHCQFLPPTRDDISKGKLTGVRALLSMAIMLLIGALGYPPFFKQMSTGVLKIGFMALLSSIGGICSLIGMLIVTISVGNLPGHINYGYSYFLGWTGTGLSFFTAALIYIASKDNLYTEGVYA